MTDAIKAASTAPAASNHWMTPAVAKRGHDWEYWYTLIALLFITGALAPLLAALGGAQVEDRGDSNPVRLGLATLLYFIAGLLAR